MQYSGVLTKMQSEIGNPIQYYLVFENSLRLGGSSQIYENNNTFFGDLSAILIENMPIWAEFSSTPSSSI